VAEAQDAPATRRGFDPQHPEDGGGQTMAAEHAIPDQAQKPALKRAATRLRAWWDGDDPTHLLDEIAGMAGHATGATADAADAPPMSARLKAWWDGRDPWQPPERSGKTGGEAGAARLKPAATGGAVRGATAAANLKLPPAKLDAWTKLWGEGFCEPFDKRYVADMVKPFALNEKMTVLDLGARLGGGTRAVAERFKVWITGMDPDPEYAKAAMQFSVKAGLKSRAPVVAYDIEKMTLPKQRYNCVFALETFHRAKNKQQLFTNVAQAVTDGGQVLFTDFVLREAGKTSALIEAWKRVEPFAPHPWGAAQVAKALKELRLDARVDEDMTEKYRRLALFGWQACLDRLAEQRAAGVRPPRALLSQLLDDAELWVLRLRALDSGLLQVRRYFALKR